MDFQRSCGGLAEKPPTSNAKKFFEHKAYNAGGQVEKLIKEQDKRGEDFGREDVSESNK